MGASKASILYIYIYRLHSINSNSFSKKKKI